MESMIPTVDRHVHIAEQVVFVDGLTGTGKTMMGPILGSLDRVEVQRFDHIHEFVCALKFLDRIEDDAAVHLIRTYIDLACYNIMIGRESNFRWKDLSGVLSNPRGFRYLWRLFQPDGDQVMDRIKQERPIVQIASHQLLGVGTPLFSALGDRLRIIETVRHPLYLLQHWYSYIDRHGSDPREFTVWLNHNGNHLPWFASGWEEVYIESNKMDRVIYSIDWLARLAISTLESLQVQSQAQVIIIPFERFVVEPEPYIERICQALGTTTTNAIKRAMRKQNIPRKLTTAGIDLEIYRRYDWEPPDKTSNEAAEMKSRWDYAGLEASEKGMETLNRMCQDYDSRYMTESLPL